MELTSYTLVEQAHLLAEREVSSLQIVDAHLKRIRQLEGQLGSFAEVYETQALQEAAAADQMRAAGVILGPLHGLPIAVKDLFDIADRVGTMGSMMWRKRTAAVTSATVEKLRSAGMIIVGKLKMVEFAFGADGINPLMGTPRNPWDLRTSRIPGGSSSGCGVAVAAGLVPAAIGSDTGGSVRVPAAFNGLVGLKATTGRVSLHGTGLLSWTLDSVGPLARCVEDSALLLEALAGVDPRDPDSLAQRTLDLRGWQADRAKGMRVAMPEPSQLPASTRPCVVKAWEQAAECLRELGARVIPIRLPCWFFESAKPVGIIISSEAYSLHRDWIEDASQPLGDEVRTRILAAKNFGPADYALALRTMMERRRVFDEWFQAYDALLLPTTPYPAPPVYEALRISPGASELTRAGNYLGLCGIALPAGLHEGLPVSIQLLGKAFCERTILALGAAYQSASGYRNLQPTLLATGST